MLLKQSSIAQPLMFQMIDSSDHIAGKTGLTPTVTLSKNGAAFASPAGSVTELANGWYKVAGNATDTGTLGPLILHATSAGADPVDVVFNVVAFDPQDAIHLGLTSLPNVASGAAGAIPTTGSGANQIAVNGSGAISTVAAVSGAVGSVTGAVGSVTGNVGGNVTGTVASVVGAVGSVTGNVAGKVLGGGAGTITGVGAWILDSTGQTIGSVVAGGLTGISGDLASEVIAPVAAIKAKTDQFVFTVANQVDCNVITKTGFGLAATGLDSITVTPPSTVATTFPGMLVQLWRRYFKKATLTSTQLKTLADDGTTVVTTQTVSNDGTTQTQGPAA